MANLVDVGDLNRITGTFTDADGTAQDPTAVYFTYTDPSGNTASLQYGVDAAVVKSSTGVYYVDVDVDEAGLWHYRWYSTGTGQASDEGYFVAEQRFATTNVYAMVPELRDRLGISGTTEDAKLARVAEGVSRAIDEECGQRFYTTAADETRYFTAKETDLLYPGPVVSVTSLSTDQDGDRTYETTWAATDYDLEPYNASADSKPYTSIRVTPAGNYSFPTVRKGIKLVGKFGWSRVPGFVREATLLQAHRIYKRREAPFGVVGGEGAEELTVLPSLDPDVRRMLHIALYGAGVVGAV